MIAYIVDFYLRPHPGEEKEEQNAIEHMLVPSKCICALKRNGPFSQMAHFY